MTGDQLGARPAATHRDAHEDVSTASDDCLCDVCRARADMVIDQTRARHRLGKFLLRHGRVWRGGENWTLKHGVWIRPSASTTRR